jgi:two-component system, sensor histidine kinase PdtaS
MPSTRILARAAKSSPRPGSSNIGLRIAPPQELSMKDATSPPHGDSRSGKGASQSQKPFFATSSRLLAELIDLAEDAIISIGGDQRILLFNRGAEQVFGYSAREVLGKPLDILLPKSMSARHREQVSDFATSSVPARSMRERQTIRGRRKDGTEFPAEASISKVISGGEMLLTVILRDITERVAAEQKLQDSLREKEALLREIHHRVKNNLQVMSSLLGLQSRAIAKEETRRAFEDSQDRIRSMALLHEMLCESGNLARIDLTEYVRELVHHLLRSYDVDTKRLRVSMHLGPVFLDQDGAVPFGLILNELVVNALRHAFPEDRQGEIRIELRELPGRQIRLRVEDDGVGLVTETGWQSGSSLGFRLVRMLVEQLGGKLEMQPRDPTRFELTFAAR